MLTLKKINEISFRKSGFSGYKPEDVDDFIDEVSESFAALLKENQSYKAKAAELAAKNVDMREKLVALAEKVEAYRADEDGIKNALLSAQKLANASIKDAKKQAELIIAEANAKADDILNEANKKSLYIVENYKSKIEEKEREYDAIKEEVTNFRSSLYEIYKNHITAIEAIPDYTDELKSKVTVKEEVKVQEPVAETVPEKEPVIEIAEEKVTAEKTAFELDTDTKLIDTFDDIDLNAYTDIPESLKKEKESLYSTLEFGEGINIKK
ncbi:MAG: DivIVA domain-containing protein [Ruminococcaceae bacterium]|nr:DivIVA domain-containing protein [Oscillospiraceae bacterium]